MPDDTSPSQETTEANQAEETTAAPKKRTPRKRAAKKATTSADSAAAETPDAETPAAEAPAADESTAAAEQPAAEAPKTVVTRRTRSARKVVTPKTAPASKASSAPEPAESEPQEASQAAAVTAPLFQAPTITVTKRSRRQPAKKAAVTSTEGIAGEEVEDQADDAAQAETTTGDQPVTDESTANESTTDQHAEQDGSQATNSDSHADADSNVDSDAETDTDDESGEGSGGRRRRRRGGRRRRKGSGSGEGGSESGETSDSSDEETQSRSAAQGEVGDESAKDESAQEDGKSKGDGKSEDDDQNEGSGTSRRRRRRRRAGESGGDSGDDPAKTTTRVRKARNPEDEITAVSGSTRLEAKKQRRREGREAGRRRAPIVSEAEFLARRESVDRVMVVREREDLTQIAVLEDKVLVEHYVARESQTSLIGNIYLGRVQNVLPSMEAAFIDIGKGRNAVLYAGEVNWSALGHKEGSPRTIESVLSSGQTVLVQVTKDPIGQKGARLTSQISLPGRFLVYVPDGTNSGISRKLPDTERTRLKTLLKEIVPSGAGVIVRTAAEGASEEELTRDVERLTARWADIEKKKGKGSAPQLLYGEPDLTLKVVRDLFTEDFSKLVIEGEKAWETVHGYVDEMAPDLVERVQRFEPQDGSNSFSTYRIDEQIAKGLDRKVWLPSGGSLIIDRTEAMTVVDVNTGKFTGSGGNLEETVTKNNLEAAEEMVRQLRLRDIGGIIVIDFIDMVLESNRDLVLRRLVECLGRDRTRHQVAEVTSLGLVQMTRKRIGTGLLEAFSETCEHCGGRGLHTKDVPVEPKSGGSDDDGGGSRRSRRSRGGRGRGGENGSGAGNASSEPKPTPSPKDVAAMARPDTKPVEDAADEATPPPNADETAPVAMDESAADQATETVTQAQSPLDEAPASSVDAAAESEADAPAVQPKKKSTRSRRKKADVPAMEAAPEVSSDEAAAQSGVGTPPSDGVVEPGVGEVEPGPGGAAANGESEQASVDAPVTHVPVKKRGARKR